MISLRKARSISMAMLLVSASQSVAAAPVYLQCGWEERNPETWTFKIDFAANTVEMLPPTYDVVRLDVGEGEITFYTDRMVTYNIDGWEVLKECKDLAREYGYDYQRMFMSIPSKMQDCSTPVDYISAESRTKFTINRVTGEFRYWNTATEDPRRNAGRINGECQKVERRF